MSKRAKKPTYAPPSEGADTFFGRLAEKYRFRPGGSAASGETVNAGRPVIGIEELVKAAADAAIYTSPGEAGMHNRKYVCIYTHKDTGLVVARIVTMNQFAPGTPRSTVYSRARKASDRIFRSGKLNAYMPIGEKLIGTSEYKVECKRVGPDLIVPSVPPP